LLWAVLVVASCSGDNLLVVFGDEDTAEGDVPADNTPPEVTLLDLGPAPRTDEVLTATIETDDAEGDAVSLDLRWSINGAPIDHNDLTLDGAFWFDRDDIILLSVTPSDGLALGESVRSEALTVLNTPPTAPQVAIEPSEPEEGVDSLSCVVAVESEDADEDDLSYAILWSVDGTDWSGDTVPASETLADQVWTCSVVADDGTHTGAAGTATVTIAESPIPNECPDDNCALRFDGIDDYIEIEHAEELSISTDGLTVEAWVYFDVLKGNCMTVVRKGTSESASFEYWLHKNWAPEDSLYWGSWPAWTVVDFDALSGQVWHHYAGVYDPDLDEARVYLDGIERTTAALTSAVVPGDEVVRIGIDWDMGCAMDGVIDEVRISLGVRYSGDFTPQTAFGVDEDTLALYHLNSYTGSVAYDHSGGGHDGIISGAEWTTESP
jgi:hypothetical protein